MNWWDLNLFFILKVWVTREWWVKSILPEFRPVFSRKLMFFKPGASEHYIFLCGLVTSSPHSSLFLDILFFWVKHRVKACFKCKSNHQFHEWWQSLFCLLLECICKFRQLFQNYIRFWAKQSLLFWYRFVSEKLWTKEKFTMDLMLLIILF